MSSNLTTGTKYAHVVQLAESAVSKTACCEFESHHEHHLYNGDTMDPVDFMLKLFSIIVAVALLAFIYKGCVQGIKQGNELVSSCESHGGKYISEKYSDLCIANGIMIDPYTGKPVGADH